MSSRLSTLLLLAAATAASGNALAGPTGGPSLENLLLLSTSRGYEVETHYVVTADFYIMITVIFNFSVNLYTV